MEVGARLLDAEPVAKVVGSGEVGVALVAMVTTAHSEAPTPLAGWTSRIADTTAQNTTG